MNEDHPALVAARDSWASVQAKDKARWLALMADDVLIEDPIGRGPTNPTGEGVRGRAEVEAFWDRNIEPATIRIETHESRVAGDESAHLLTLRTTLPGGVTAVVRGIFTYRVDGAGRLISLRGYWTPEDMTFERPEGADAS